MRRAIERSVRRQRVVQITLFDWSGTSRKETYPSHADLLWFARAVAFPCKQVSMPHNATCTDAFLNLRLQPSPWSLCSRSLSCQRWLGDMTSCRKWRVTCGPFWSYLGSMQFGDALFGFVWHFCQPNIAFVWQTWLQPSKRGLHMRIVFLDLIANTNIDYLWHLALLTLLIFGTCHLISEWIGVQLSAGGAFC